MTREETKDIVMKIKVLYPNWKPENLTMTVDAWAAVLIDFPKDIVDAALAAYVTGDESGFAPSPSKLIGLMRKANKKPLDVMTASEAWALVYDAIGRSGGMFPQYSVDEFEKLPELCKKAVGRPENLREMALDENFNMGVEKSLFERKYEALLQRQEEYDKIPRRMKDLIQQTDMKMLEG